MEKEVIRKIKEKEDFTEKEIEDLVWESEFEQVWEEEGEDHRWQREMSTVIKVGDYFVRIDWLKGLTECQESEYLKNPYFVKEKKTTKTIEVVDWEEEVDE